MREIGTKFGEPGAQSPVGSFFPDSKKLKPQGARGSCAYLEAPSQAVQLGSCAGRLGG